MDVGPAVEVNTIAPYPNRRIGEDDRPASPFARDLFPWTCGHRGTGARMSPVPGSPA